MSFEIVRNDITDMQVGAIVNASDRYPCVNSGVEAAIHEKAGPALFEARKKVGYISAGDAAITPAFDLGADYVIHAATPVWTDGCHGETETLRAAYDRSLELALEYGCDSVAFPLLASGNNGFPKSTAMQTAVSAFSEFLLKHDMDIYLVVFGRECLMLSQKLFDNVKQYIDDNYVITHEAIMESSIVKRRYSYESDEFCPTKEICSPSLSEYLEKKDAGFMETLLDIIAERDLKNSQVYKKANISKQHFSKLMNDPDARPSKQTAIALALALELDVDDTCDLIGRAGFTLTNSSTFDLIIKYFIEHRQFNIIEINMALYDFDQPLLGA